MQQIPLSVLQTINSKKICPFGYNVLLICFLLQQYYENRLKMLASLRSTGIDPYPHKFDARISIADYVAKYNSLGAGEHLLAVNESLAGTVF